MSSQAPSPPPPASPPGTPPSPPRPPPPFSLGSLTKVPRLSASIVPGQNVQLAGEGELASALLDDNHMSAIVISGAALKWVAVRVPAQSAVSHVAVYGDGGWSNSIRPFEVYVGPRAGDPAGATRCGSEFHPGDGDPYAWVVECPPALHSLHARPNGQLDVRSQSQSESQYVTLLLRGAGTDGTGRTVFVSELLAYAGAHPNPPPPPGSARPTERGVSGVEHGGGGGRGAAAVHGRFRGGFASNVLAEAGVLVHVYDGQETSDDPLSVGWWDAYWSHASISASLIRKEQPTLFGGARVAVVLEPRLMAPHVRCAFAGDGGSSGGAGAGCLRYCDDDKPELECAWPPSRLKKMLEVQAELCPWKCYNEVLVSTIGYLSVLPRGMEAVVLLPSAKAEDRALAERMRAQFLAHFHLPDEALPLLRFDGQNFTEAA